VRQGPACSPPAWGEARRSMAETLAASQVLIGMAAACAATAAELRSDAARLRIRAESIRQRQAEAVARHRVRSFSLDGTIEDRPVHAEWRDRRLIADPLLLERAELLVEIGEEFLAGEPGAFAASLTGPPIVALLTLMRACDRVRSIDVLTPPGGGLPPWSAG
jgi:hypothetical protein